MESLRKPMGSEQCIYSGSRMSSHVEAIGTWTWASNTSGTTPNNSWHNSNQSIFVLSVKGLSSTEIPSSTETSCSVIVVSPHFKWNVCVSGLHLSIKALTNAPFTFNYANFIIGYKLEICNRGIISSGSASLWLYTGVARRIFNILSLAPFQICCDI